MPKKAPKGMHMMPGEKMPMKDSEMKKVMGKKAVKGMKKQMGKYA